MYAPCCHYHITKTIQDMLASSNFNSTYVVNTHITVIDDKNNEIKQLHFANVSFGPETESDNEKRNFEEFSIEMDRIGSISVPDEMYETFKCYDLDLMCYESLDDI